MIFATRALAGPAAPLDVYNQPASYKLNSHLEVLEGENPNLTATGRLLDPLMLNESRELWMFDLSVHNRSSEPLDVVISSGFPLYELSIRDKQTLTVLGQSGSGVKPAHKLTALEPAIRVILEPGLNHLQLGVNLRGNPFLSNFKLTTTDKFKKTTQLSIAAFVFLGGCMLGLIVYSFLYAFSLKKREFLYYCLLASSYLALEVIISGIPPMVFDPPYSHIIGSSWILWNALCMVGLCLFTNAYFSTAARYPRFTKLAYGFVSYSLLTPLAFLLWPNLVGKIYITSEIIMYMCIISVALLEVKKNNLSTYIYFSAFIPALLVLLLFMAQILHLTSSTIELNSFRFAAVCFTFALFLVGYSLLIDKTRSMHQALSSSLKGMLSAQKLNRIIESGKRYEGQPKSQLMTVIFIDIVGYSKATSNLTHEISFNAIRNIINQVTSIIHQHGGIVDRSMGDGIISFFGYDLLDTYEGHAAQAVSAAIEIQEMSIRHFLRETSRQAEPLFPLRIGINTDVVCIGNLGDSERFDISLVGEGVFLARRFEATCEPHKIVIGQKTYEALPDKWRSDPRLSPRYIPTNNPQHLLVAYECNPFYDRSKLLQIAREHYYLDSNDKGREARHRTTGQTMVLMSDFGPMEVINFSTGGLCLRSRVHLSRGSLLDLTLSPFLDDPKARFISPVKVEVAWGTPERDGFCFLGVRYHDLNTTQREYIFSCLKDKSGAALNQQTKATSGKGVVNL